MRALFPLPSIRRTSALSTVALLAAGGLSGTLFAADQSRPQPPEQAKAAAEALRQEALACEIYGLDEKRDELLAKAEALAPEHPAIKWQRGIVFYGGRWTPAEDVAVSSTDRAQIEKYVAKRDAAEDTATGHLELAHWCSDQRLVEQERAHLTRVLALEPDHAKVRERLGYVRVDGEWVGRDEIARAYAEQAKIRASLSRYGNDFERLARSLSIERDGARDEAIASIRAVRDVDAIPALEQVVATKSVEAALLALEALSNMPEKEASLSLARFASFSRSNRVRDKATNALRNRPFDHFVPAMLATMRGSVLSHYSLERRQDARLVYSQVFYRDARRLGHTTVNEVVYVNSQPSLVLTKFGSASPEVNGSASDDRAVAEAAAEDSARRTKLAEAQVEYENWNVREFNAHLSETLATVTGEDLGPYAEAWWSWWNRYNQVTASGAKPLTVQHSQLTASVGYEQYPERARITDIRQPQKYDSCFVAGTIVPTNRGEAAIEEVRVGDLVLSQNVETGELAFKPVLETTVRPPAEILKIEHEGGSLRCTGGHPFWVSGEGWVHARHLKSGMELHTPIGSVRVSDVVSDGEEPAYNLIVADFANYFVGKARILSHDNSSRQPTDAIVPGLEQK